MKVSLFLLFCVSYTLAGLSQDNVIMIDSTFKELEEIPRTIAVLPFRVETVLRPSMAKKMDPAQKALLEYTQGYNIQATIIKIFEQKMENKSDLFSMQDSSLTNEILKSAGLNQYNYTTFSPQALGVLLQVDAVISGNLKTWKPIGSGWAFFFNTVDFLNTAEILHDDDDLVDDYSHDKVPAIIGDIEIYLVNTKDEAVLWKYYGAQSVGAANFNGLITKILRKAVRNFPYADMDSLRLKELNPPSQD